MILNGDELGISPLGIAKKAAKGVGKAGKGVVKLYRKGVCLSANVAAGVGSSNPDPRSQAAALGARAVANSAICKKGQKYTEVQAPACGFFQKLHRAFGGHPPCADAPAGALKGSDEPYSYLNEYMGGGPADYRKAIEQEGGTSSGTPRVSRSEYDVQGLGAAPAAKPIMGTPKAAPVPVVSAPVKIATIAGSVILGGAIVLGLQSLQKH
jgi:hypothetical protein